MKQLAILFFICLYSFNIWGQRDDGSIPCWNIEEFPDVKDSIKINGFPVAKQSSTQETGIAAFAIDGNITGNWETQNISRTTIEANPYLDIDLGQSLSLAGLRAYYSEELYPEGLSNYYIFVSVSPFETASLLEVMSREDHQMIHVEAPQPSGQLIPLGFASGRYVRLQLAEEGFLSFAEVLISGGGVEVCDNGRDDDCDGDIDCEDSDCLPTILNLDVTTHRPTCQVCENGKIVVQASGRNLEYSIDGGTTFQDSPVFENLSGGDYAVMVRNKVGGCTTEGTAQLSALRGLLNSCCMNGGFENGDFEGWTGGVGQVNMDTGVAEFDNDSLSFVDDNRFDLVINGPDDTAPHQIINKDQNYTDPLIGDLPLFNEGSGNYIVRLGNRTTQRGATRLTYCFEVTDCNEDFYFNYLFVLEDPNHFPEDTLNPFFEYAFYLQESGELIGDKVRDFGDTNNEFYQVQEGQGDEEDIAYTFWTCATQNLSAHLGEVVCAEFVTGDCADGAHFGYAYIDGLCTPKEDALPQALVNIEAAYCGVDNPILLDASRSYGFNQYAWEVCQVDGQDQTFNCVEQDLTIGDQLDTFDIGNFYQQGGETFTCNQKYRIKLTLTNSCTEPVELIRYFTYYCDGEITLTYPDVINCLSEQANVPIEGTIDCNNCEIVNIEWMPAEFLDDATVQNPVILGSRNVNAFNRTYRIEALNDRGCKAETTIETTNVIVDDLSTEVIEDHCSFEFIGTVQLLEPFTGDNFEVDFKNTVTGDIRQGILISESDSSDQFVFNIIFQKNDRTLDGEWIVEIPSPDGTNNNCLESYIGAFESTDLFYGNMEYWVSSGFSPNNDGNNEVFNVRSPRGDVCGYDSTLLDYCSNAYRIQIKIFNRWGEKVYDEAVTAPLDSPMTSSAISWDGTFNGTDLSPDVFGVSIGFENCSHLDGFANSCTREVLEKMYIVDGKGIFIADSTCTSYAGNLTLQR